jgi:ABC-type uncharacterized transport system permease subunit
VTWLTFGGLIFGRSLAGFRGRRAAVATIVGFAAALVVLGIYLLRRTVAG